MSKKRRKVGKGKLISLNQIPLHHGGQTNKACPFSVEGAPKIDYKDVKLLRRYVSEQGKMMPSRITLISQKKQRVLAREIKRARFLALMPFLQEDKTPKPRPPSKYDNNRYGDGIDDVPPPKDIPEALEAGGENFDSVVES